MSKNAMLEVIDAVSVLGVDKSDKDTREGGTGGTFFFFSIEDCLGVARMLFSLLRIVSMLLCGGTRLLLLLPGEARVAAARVGVFEPAPSGCFDAALDECVHFSVLFELGLEFAEFAGVQGLG